MSSQHLLCIYPWLELGGADKFNLDMLACLVDRGWRATIVTTTPSTHPWRSRFQQLTDDIVDLADHPPERYPEQLLQVIRSRPIDCVLISCSSLAYELLPYLRAHLPDMPFADYCHMVEPQRRDEGYPRMSLNNARYLDQQIVSSQSLKRWMCERGGDPAKIAVCTTNIDSELWSPERYDRQQVRAELGIPPAAPIALYVARLERQKQPLLAIKAIRQVAARLPEAHFLIAGTGLFAGCLRGFVRRHGLEARVRLLGPTSNERVRQLLAASDVFFLPSEMEGISLAVYEAMAMGVAPLTADVGGQAELVLPGCGVLVAQQAGTAAMYAAELERLLRHQALTQQLGAASRQRIVKHFGLEQMGNHMHELLMQARSRRGATKPAAIEPERVRAAIDGAVVAARAARTQTPRRRLRQIYWQVADGRGWWLIYWIEHLRRPIRGLRLRRQQVAQARTHLAGTNRH